MVANGMGTMPDSLGEPIFHVELVPAQPGMAQQGCVERLEALTIAAIARLDQRSELLAQLRAQGKRLPVPVTDAALILHAYDAWGTQALKHLSGDFAFVIHDTRRDQVFCARDHLGIEPLFYTRDSTPFACASSIATLLRHGGASTELDRNYFVNRLAGGLVEDTATPYNEVRRLFPGHYIVATPFSLKVRRYWHPGTSPPIRLADEREYVDQFRELFRTAIADRVPTDSPVGVLLSGGLDSTAVYGVTHQVCIQQGLSAPRAVSGIFDRFRECDERHYIRAMTAQYGVQPHWVPSDSCWILKDWADACAQADEPSYGILVANLSHHWLGTAAGAGLPILLSGHGGDDVLGHSNTIIADYLRTGRWLAALNESVALASSRQLSVLGVLRRYGLEPLFQKPQPVTWLRHQEPVQEYFPEILYPSVRKQTAALFNHARFDRAER